MSCRTEDHQKNRLETVTVGGRRRNMTPSKFYMGICFVCFCMLQLSSSQSLEKSMSYGDYQFIEMGRFRAEFSSKLFTEIDSKEELLKTPSSKTPLQNEHGRVVPDSSPLSGKLLLIYICNLHVLSHLLLIYIFKLHWNQV